MKTEIGSSLPLTFISPLSLKTKELLTKFIVYSGIITESVGALDSILEARLTASPYTV